jgi:ABC-type multidrug transport system fused ATPase/permease subunit
VGFNHKWVQYHDPTSSSLERIERYVNIEHEKAPSELGVPPAYWPADGSLRVENLSARYSPGGPRVLHEISFNINAGERVGIVGRTGSGKVREIRCM